MIEKNTTTNNNKIQKQKHKKLLTEQLCLGLGSQTLASRVSWDGEQGKLVEFRVLNP